MYLTSINYSYPIKIAILFKITLAYIQEVIKYASIETINVMGSLNENIPNQVINKIPKLNDYSNFVGIHECCMDNTFIRTLLDNNMNE